MEAGGQLFDAGKTVLATELFLTTTTLERWIAYSKCLLPRELLCLFDYLSLRAGFLFTADELNSKRNIRERNMSVRVNSSLAPREHR